MGDRLSQISTGYKNATAYDWFNRMGKRIKGLFPEGESGPVEANEGSKPSDLGKQIAGVSRMVQNPESTSTDWGGMQDDFMETGDLTDITDEDLALLFGEVTGNEPSSRYEMIERLTKIRDRQYSR